MEIVPLTGGLGAEIIGADIRRAEDFDAIRAAFAKHSVIVLRAQKATLLNFRRQRSHYR